MKPSEAIEQGLCPSCAGTGWVNRVVPVPHEGPCSSCAGVGTLESMWEHQDELAAIESEQP